MSVTGELSHILPLSEIVCTRVLEANCNSNKHVIVCMLKLREEHSLTTAVRLAIMSEFSELNLMVSEIHDTYRAIFETVTKNNFLWMCMVLVSC